MTNGGSPRQLLLCEGPDDREFFKLLIQARGLPAFRVRHNGTKEDPTGGNTKFVSGLKAHYEIPGGLRRFDKVLIVSDNDDEPDQSFERVRAQIETHFGFAPPAADQVVNGPPYLKIQMIPADGELGNLETLCIEAARRADAEKAGHVDTFAALARTDNWDSACRKGEMWLRSNLAARCEGDPFVTLRNVFTVRRNQFLIPINDQSFDAISDVLSGF